MKLPPKWSYAGFNGDIAMYTDQKLIVGLRMFHPRKGQVTIHATVTRVDNRRPVQTDMDIVKKLFFNHELAAVVENNNIQKTSEIVRSLWQRVDVSVVTGDLLTPEMTEKIQGTSLVQ